MSRIIRKQYGSIVHHLTKPRLIGGRHTFSNHSVASKGAYEFETGSELTHIKDGSFSINFNNDWSVGDALNGGYLMAVAVKAAQNVVNLDPLTITGYYMNKGLENTPAAVDVVILNKSKSTSTVQVSITQLGLLRTQYVGVFGHAAHDKNGINHSKLTAPSLPPIADCIDGTAMLRGFMGEKLTIGNRVEFRLAADSPYARGFLKKKASHDAQLDCWVAFADGFKPDMRSLALFSDSFPPCVLNHVDKFAWVPTLEYAVQFWARPPALGKDNEGYYDDRQWLRARYHSDHLINGMLYTDGELWSADGQTLLATSRQLAKLMIPR